MRSRRPLERPKATPQNFLDAVKKIMKRVVRNSYQGQQAKKQKHISQQKHKIASAKKDNQYSNEYISFKSNLRIHN